MTFYFYMHNWNVHKDISKNISEIQKQIHYAPDLVIRRINISSNQITSVIIYLSDLTDEKNLQEHVLAPLIKHPFDKEGDLLVTIGNMRKDDSFSSFIHALLNGESLLFIQGYTHGYIFSTQKGPTRQPQSMLNEMTMRGTQQSFIETSTTNISLIRQYLPYEELIIKKMSISTHKKNKVFLLYIKDTISTYIVENLQNRLENIQTTHLINAGELVEELTDNKYSPFPQIKLTERPDFVATHLLEGRCAVILEHSSQVLIAPMNFTSFFKTMDDYTMQWYTASFFRILRFLGFFMALFFPALYIAIVSVNYEIIPVDLFLLIVDSRKFVPFPPFLEMCILLTSLEMMREAAIRLPSPIGPTVGIVAGTILGEAAVQAGIVGNISIIVIGTTALGSYILPNTDMEAAIRIARLPLIILASIFGLVGVSVGIMSLLAHLINLQSLGVPYMQVSITAYKDTILRLPLQYIRSKIRK